MPYTDIFAPPSPPPCPKKGLFSLPPLAEKEGDRMLAEDSALYAFPNPTPFEGAFPTLTPQNKQAKDNPSTAPTPNPTPTPMPIFVLVSREESAAGAGRVAGDGVRVGVGVGVIEEVGIGVAVPLGVATLEKEEENDAANGVAGMAKNPGMPTTVASPASSSHPVKTKVPPWVMAKKSVAMVMRSLTPERGSAT